MASCRVPGSVSRAWVMCSGQTPGPPFLSAVQVSSLPSLANSHTSLYRRTAAQQSFQQRMTLQCFGMTEKWKRCACHCIIKTHVARFSLDKYKTPCTILGSVMPNHPILAPRRISCSPCLLFCTYAGWQRQLVVHGYAGGLAAIVDHLNTRPVGNAGL